MGERYVVDNEPLQNLNFNFNIRCFTSSLPPTCRRSYSVHPNVGLIRPGGEATVKIRLELDREASSEFPVNDKVMVRSFREGAQQTSKLRCLFPSRRAPAQQDGFVQAAIETGTHSRAQEAVNVSIQDQEVKSTDPPRSLAGSFSRGPANFCTYCASTPCAQCNQQPYTRH